MPPLDDSRVAALSHNLRTALTLASARLQRALRRLRSNQPDLARIETEVVAAKEGVDRAVAHVEHGLDGPPAESR